MSVYKRKDTWYIDIIVSGLRISRKLPVKTRVQALRIQEEIKTKFRLGLLHISDFDHTRLFRIEAERYLAHCKGLNCVRTYEEDKRNYELHVAPLFSDKTIQSITDENILDYQAHLKSKGYSNRSVNIYMGLIRKILRYSKKCGHLKNLDLRFPMLPEPQKHHAFLTPEEFNKLLGGFHSRLAYLRTIFARHTGMRPAELTYLAWNDIDFELRTAKIQAKEGWSPKKMIERVIPLNNEALSILEQLYKDRKGPWVFSLNDRPVKSIRRALQSAAREAGIKKVTPNMLRHTFCTHLLLAGADIKSVMDLMGHTDMATTQRYIHSIEKHLKDTVKLLEGNHVGEITGNYLKTTLK